MHDLVIREGRIADRRGVPTDIADGRLVTRGWVDTHGDRGRLIRAGRGGASGPSAVVAVAVEPAEMA